MTRAGRLLRNLIERLLDKYYEGPNPPRRFAEEVLLFRAMHPVASAEQWTSFASRLAASAYRDGFVRGYDWNERTWPGPVCDPELMAEAEQQDWSLADMSPRLAEVLATGADPNDPLAYVPESERAAFLETLGRSYGFVLTVDR